MTLRASDRGHQDIQRARNGDRQKWVVAEGNLTPLIEASKWLLQEKAQEKGWDYNDSRWIDNVEKFLRFERGESIAEIKRKIKRSKEGTYLERLKKLIDAEEALAHGISYRTWSSFASPTMRLAINEDAFKAYCHILGLTWQDIVEQERDDATNSQPIRHNLPGRDGAFIGRETELKNLLEFLSFDSPTSRVSIEGCGGVGKTALILETAYRYLHTGKKTASDPNFEAIIFTSAKTQYLNGETILPRRSREQTLRDIFRTIARTLNHPNILRGDFEQQQQRILYRLSQQRTLLIIDNLETFEEREIVWSFLQDLPLSVKAVITARIPVNFHRITLESLLASEGLALIAYQAQNKGVVLAETAASEIYQKTSGIPAAIVYVMGQLAFGYSQTRVLERLPLPTSAVTRFYFEGSIQPLRGQLAHQILMAAALFPQPALAVAILATAMPEPVESDAIENALVTLQQLSLIKCRGERYQMISLTREYMFHELRSNPDFEAAARERWLLWYLHYSQQHGGQDGKEWNSYDKLEEEWENIQEVIDWCIVREKYESVLKFWQQVKGYSHALGYNRDRATHWHSRLDWIEWLMQFALQQQDWATAAEAMNDRAWTLTLMGQVKHLQEAESLLNRTWQIRLHQTVSFQVDVALNIAVLRIKQNCLKQANYWLKKALKLSESNGEIDSRKRQLIHISYYRGRICFQTGDYQAAKSYYQQTLDQAREIKWQRAIALAQSWLGDIAVEQGNFEEAEKLLQESLQIARQNQDKSREAYCKESLAFLAKAQNCLTEATRWAHLAIADFTGLGMYPEVERMTAFLQSRSRSN